ncbi:hypothetical protein KIPB_006686 [Kipferlia bialata]|uniref:Uncharacterized protein n=1 Tax=Kipferlia bialata TaxID=797122 RepID=A0A9K3CYW8_9EUKA|nr:hypothetical protein KIPB_006686 [Kipferlia bialata]|eukprot:g6686.t1
MGSAPSCAAKVDKAGLDGQQGQLRTPLDSTTKGDQGGSASHTWVWTLVTLVAIVEPLAFSAETAFPEAYVDVDQEEAAEAEVVEARDPQMSARSNGPKSQRGGKSRRGARVPPKK